MAAATAVVVPDRPAADRGLARAVALVPVPDRAVPLAAAPSREVCPSPRRHPNRRKNRALVR